LAQTADVELKEGEPLKRTDSTTKDGELKNISVTVRTDWGKIDPMVIRAINCVLMMLVVIGNNTTLPLPEGLDGVSVAIRGGDGFGSGTITKGSFVVLPGGLKKIADKGVALFPVAGRYQQQEIAPNAPTVNRTFSVKVEATADPPDGHSIAFVFINSFLCGLAVKPLACVNAVANVAKQFYWDLGEWDFKLTDWGSTRPVFVVDTYNQVTIARLDGAEGGTTTMREEMMPSTPPPMSTTEGSCDPSGFCPLALNFNYRLSSTVSFYRHNPPSPRCDEKYSRSVDGSGDVSTVPIPPVAATAPFAVLDRPPTSNYYIGTTESKCGVYVLPNGPLPGTASQPELDPALMLSGKPVSLTWSAKGQIHTTSEWTMEWGWERSVVFHRVNADGSPYSP
jgi:hypothetical protein